ncbi:uncharacterized protein LOC113522706 [Galleria mellonella]|uniref:Uncharacterized protein LOC113522706 n=1 Tax=Galleria mellonella TaxID=7137 RepID=A0A6J1X4M0_GALME|nr:uncharacterized protein LOC113522706 [Galleria mellonella]
MAPNRHASLHINHNMFICVVLSLLLPMVGRSAARTADYSRGFPNDEDGRKTVEYHLRQGALRGLIVKPSRQYDLQYVEMFLGIPYAAPPIGSMRFMPPVSALPWSGVKMATRFAPVCPQSLPSIKKGNPPTLERQNYMNRLKPFLMNESEDCLYLNIYVPHRETKSKKFPVLVFIHGDSFEWGSGNPYDGRILAAYGNIMVITLNYRLGILGFLKPSTTEHVFGNNGLLDQLAALTWIRDNIEDMNGDPTSVTLIGHGTGAACVNFLLLSSVPNGLFHRAILMSGSALSDWAMTKNPLQYTLQVAQSVGCYPNAKNMMTCLQNKPLSQIKKVQILAREFETPLGPTVTGNFITNEPAETMKSFPNLTSNYQLLSGVTELESYHDFGAIEVDYGILENQRDDFIIKYSKIIFEGNGREVLKDILKQYAPSKLDPQRWSVEANRDVILNLFSDARTLAPLINFANYQSKAKRQSYFYVFGHNSVSTDYASLNKSVHGEELPYVLGVPLGGANTHFHTEYTQKEKLLSEVMMRLWTNFVKIGTPNTQSVNKYYTLDHREWNQYNVEWPEYDVEHQSYLRLDITPYVSSLYRSNYTNFWLETLPKKMRRFLIDRLFEYAPKSTTHKPKSTYGAPDPNQRTRRLQVTNPPRYNAPSSGGTISRSSYFPPEPRSYPDMIYRQQEPIKIIPSQQPHLMDNAIIQPTNKPINPNMPVKMSGATMTLIISLGILFLAVNVGICSILYFKKRKLRIREQAFETTRQPRPEMGEVDVIGQKGSKDDKSALKTFKNGCSVIKSMSIDKIRDKKKHKKKLEPCKTPKSDDSGGFRERFQLRRHLSTSTLDAHTKVRDWIANEVMHRCSPGIMRKSNSDLNNDKSLTIIKPFTRSEELLSEAKRSKKDAHRVDGNAKNIGLRKSEGNKTRTSEKTTSTSALDSHSSIGSNKNSTMSIKRTDKSTDSLRSRGTESIKSKKVSVAIDATPAARTNSILNQEPIEIYKSFDCGESKHSNNENKIQRSKTEKDFKNSLVQNKPENKENDKKTFTNVITLSVDQDKPLRISHKHSSSDPVTDINYDKLMKEKMECGNQIIDILPPVTFRNDINVTSCDESTKVEPLTAAEALLTIKRRNFPKVLPDLPKAQKRLSLQPTTLQTFKSCVGSIDSQYERSKVPPQPPPRTSTLERRLAYRNSKPLTSFDPCNINKISETSTDNNYENIDSIIPYYDTSQKGNRSFEINTPRNQHDSSLTMSKERDYPKVIIASRDIPLLQEPTVIIKASSSQIEVPSNIPRVKLPDDFHSQASSVTSFSSFCSDDEEIIDDEEDFLDDLTEDKLIKELVGGVESPTNMGDTFLDSKGPETIFEKKLEIVPVKVNTGIVAPKSAEDYICISDLHLPGVSDLERTAQIKPNFGLNKLQHRTESIHRPPEKAVKLKPKRSIKAGSILSRSVKGKRSSNKSKRKSTLEYSNSGSSNDTETSTGTVKKIEVKKGT